jgi:hypothetical protein
MKSMRMALMLSFVLAAPGVMYGADDADIPQNAEEKLAILLQSGQPGEQHEKLEPLVGTWTFTSKAWMDPDQPPMETRGTIERQWVLGGRFLEEKWEGAAGEGLPGLEARGLIGYDNAQQKYTYVWLCNMATGTAIGLGDTDSQGGFTFQTEMFCPLRKRTVKGQDEIRFESEDRMVLESYEVEDGKKQKMMEIIAVRKK